MIHLSENPQDVLRRVPQQRGREVKQGHPSLSVVQSAFSVSPEGSCGG